MKIKDDKRPGTVYRFYKKCGELLYVGSSISFASRIVQHEDKPWYKEIHNVLVTHYSVRAEAYFAEKMAIKKEKPTHNLVHSGKVYRNRTLENLNALLLQKKMAGKKYIGKEAFIKDQLQNRRKQLDVVAINSGLSLSTVGRVMAGATNLNYRTIEKLYSYLKANQRKKSL